MARKSNISSARINPRAVYNTIKVDDFSGGLNTESPPLSLSLQEATVLINWVPLLGALRTRKGFGFAKTLPYYSISAFVWNGVIYTIGANGGFYVDGNLFGSVSLTGITPKFAWFDPYVCIVTGASLYLFNTQTKTLIQTNSPNAVDVLVKGGRVWIASGDTIYASAVGDPTSWTNNPNDISSSQFFQIGYKDGGNIIGLSQVYDDILIFKTSGLFRLVGEIPNVAISLVAKTRTAVNNTSITQVGTDAIAVDSNGAYSVGTAMKYGDLVIDDIGLKVRRYLIDNYDGYTAVLPPIKAIAFRLKGDENNSKWLLYFYQDKSWIEWHLPIGINLFVSYNDKVYGIGSEISVYGAEKDYLGEFIYFTQNTSIYSTQNTPIYQGDYKQIEAVYKSGILATMDAMTVTRLGVATDPEINVRNCTVAVGNLSVNFTLFPSSQPIYQNNNQIYQDTTQIYYMQARTTYHKHVAHRVFDLSLMFKTLDNFTLRGLYCDIVNSGQ